MSIQAILCVNTFSQTHEEKAATRCVNISLPLVEHTFSLTSRHEPKPYVKTTATNGDHDATAETPTAATAKTASGADENDDDPDD